MNIENRESIFQTIIKAAENWVSSLSPETCQMQTDDSDLPEGRCIWIYPARERCARVSILMIGEDFSASLFVLVGDERGAEYEECLSVPVPFDIPTITRLIQPYFDAARCGNIRITHYRTCEVVEILLNDRIETNEGGGLVLFGQNQRFGEPVYPFEPRDDEVARICESNWPE